MATAETHDKIGLLVLRTPRMDDRDALVVVRMKDWIDLHGTTGSSSGGAPTVRRSDLRGRGAGVAGVSEPVRPAAAIRVY